MMDTPYGNDATLLPVNRIKNKFYVICLALGASLSAVMFGYSLKQITSIPIQIIISNYQIKLDQDLLQGLLIAIMPFGGLFGSIAAKTWLKSLTRRKAMNLALPFLVVSIGLVQITTAYTLFIGRFLQGICVGYYVSIAPIYLKQISPKQLKSLTGTFFSCGKIAGVLLVIILELAIGQNQWRILLSIPALLGLMQFFLLAFIGSDTPYQWTARREKEIAKRLISQFYIQTQIQNVFLQIQNEIDLQNSKNQQQLFQQILHKKKKTAYFTAINVCISRHYTGGNSLIITAGVIVSQYNQKLGKWTPLIVNSIQIIALLIFIIFFSRSSSKRKLLISSMAALTALNTMLANQIWILTAIAFQMAVYGGMLLSVVWSYPSQILPASQALIPNVMHWVALTLSSLAPSLVISVMPNSQVYPCFIFFAAYSCFSLVYFSRFCVESNGAAYQEIIQNFKQW